MCLWRRDYKLYQIISQGKSRKNWKILKSRLLEWGNIRRGTSRSTKVVVLCDKIYPIVVSVVEPSHIIAATRGTMEIVVWRRIWHLPDANGRWRAKGLGQLERESVSKISCVILLGENKWLTHCADALAGLAGRHWRQLVVVVAAASAASQTGWTPDWIDS